MVSGGRRAGEQLEGFFFVFVFLGFGRFVINED